jgi:predicted GTPase
VDGAVTLRQAIVKRSDVFARTLTEKLLTYAVGRGPTYNDMPVVRSIVKNAARQNYKFSSIVLGIVTSAPFQMRINQAQEPEAAKVAAK